CESWPDPGVIAFRRTSISGDLTLNFTLTGTAKRDIDYTVPAGSTVTIADGAREAWLSFAPVKDTLAEGAETIILTLKPGAGYTIPSVKAQQAITLSMANGTTKPGVKAAVRFLGQAAFGPSADSYDGGIIPDNAQLIMSYGFDAWIEMQFRTAPKLHQPALEAMARLRQDVYWDAKLRSWWANAIGPSATDPLRQRVAFALSEIFVISDQVDSIANQPRGMANYYDMLVLGAFGNARDLLLNVSLHPCMGAYLNHLKNRKADPDAGTFPDENYAREIMQLFSIGLWMLNPDGTKMLDAEGDEIPSYDNATITSFARVFTGLSFGGLKGKEFWWPPEDWTHPMRVWDEYHDMDPKTLLNGVVLPARTASVPDKGTAGLTDIRAAVDCLFNHPNIGPFLSKQLIQRLVTSNPTPAYVGRVSAKFANNGKGVRGDMKAVIRAILLDPEARDPAQLSSTTFGKMKEPYLRTVGLARAFNARAASGVYDLGPLGELHFQQPYSSPSVFNFFRPGYSPAGPISDAGLVAPEFQILNDISAFSVPNYYYSVMRDGFNRWGHEKASWVVRPQLVLEKALYNDVPALMRRLDLVLTGGTLHPAQHQVIREAVEAINSTYWDWKNERIYMAIYLISALPEYGIQR
ncbi:MAG: DUF1800 family protein, partial [Prosthecobacter sp.]|nr:DUF1800 family protein [Prosthecobacter sp.]